MGAHQLTLDTTVNVWVHYCQPLQCVPPRSTCWNDQVPCITLPAYTHLPLEESGSI
jgi:hypothetical protein